MRGAPKQPAVAPFLVQNRVWIAFDALTAIRSNTT
jgi:hypothetical protein